MHQFLSHAVAGLAGHSIFNEYATLFLTLFMYFEHFQFSSESYEGSRSGLCFENPPASA